jgi:bacillithiol system protein YtxJ
MTGFMHPDLTALKGLEDFERLLSESDRRPLLLFKHSHSCGISAEALDELLDHLSARAAKTASGPRYAMLTVQTHRDLSNAVSARLGVRHETPQALLIRDGRVVWSASHFRVTAQAVASALTAHRPVESADAR